MCRKSVQNIKHFIHKQLDSVVLQSFQIMMSVLATPVWTVEFATIWAAVSRATVLLAGKAQDAIVVGVHLKFVCIT